MLYGMFIKSYTELAVGFDEVRAALFRRPHRWLDGLGQAVEQHREQLMVEVGLEVHGHGVRRPVLLEVGVPVASERTASLPLRMRAEDHQRLFPSLEGSLDAAWLGPGRTHLEINFQYDPPLGALGRAIDRILLHRVAEAVVGQFLQIIAERLEETDGG